MNIQEPFLPLDIMGFIAQKEPQIWQGLSSTDKSIYSIVKKNIEETNQNILKTFPSLFSRIHAVKPDEDHPIKHFMHLITKIHQEAKRLGCDVAVLSTLPLTDKLNWEFANYNTLMNELQTKIQQTKKADFDTFVFEIAMQAEVPFPAGANANEVWREILKLKNEKNNMLERIVSLGLAGKNLYFLPPEISNLPNLSFLYLGYNNLSKLPSEISSLAKLTILDLESNKLNSLPEDFHKLNKLIYLNLKYNELTEAELPASWKAFPDLQILYLNGNHINKFSDEIESLKKTGILVTTENPRKDLMSEVMDSSTWSSLEQP